MSVVAAEPVDGAGLSLADQAYVQLRRDILNGIFDAGQPLRLEALKERYGFSFSPIREALTRLSADKLVVLSSLRGFRVAPVSLDEMWDLISTRILIETEALRRSIDGGDDRWEAAVVAAVHALSLSAGRQASDADLQEELEHRHAEFHAALIAGCRSPSLLHIASKLYVQSERYRRPTLFRDRAPRGPVRNVMLEHETIMVAVLARQTDAAVSALTEHYRRTGDMIEAAMAPRLVTLLNSKKARAGKRGAAQVFEA